MTDFDTWYSSIEGCKDRALAMKAFTAGRQSLLDSDAMKEAQDVLKHEHMLFAPTILRGLIKRLIGA